MLHLHLRGQRRPRQPGDGIQLRIIIPGTFDQPRFDSSFTFPALSPDGTLIAYSTLDNLVYVCRRDATRSNSTAAGSSS